MTIKKKIAAVAAAAMMAMSITAISASAEYAITYDDPEIPDSLGGRTVGGMVSAGNYAIAEFDIDLPYFAGTTFYFAPGTVQVSLDIDDYLTGELLDRYPTKTMKDTTKDVCVTTGNDKIYASSVSLFSAHTAIDLNGQAWGAYTGLANVK